MASMITPPVDSYKDSVHLIFALACFIDFCNPATTKTLSLPGQILVFGSYHPVVSHLHIFGLDKEERYILNCLSNGVVGEHTKAVISSDLAINHLVLGAPQNPLLFGLLFQKIRAIAVSERDVRKVNWNMLRRRQVHNFKISSIQDLIIGRNSSPVISCVGCFHDIANGPTLRHIPSPHFKPQLQTCCCSRCHIFILLFVLSRCLSRIETALKVLNYQQTQHSQFKQR
mmetsp:Transcript_22409/g.41776  ORF Transcript_22409/g.41776 Transcript_22409/m.41776 type:complete len:228 (+) Transcript_22409:260-943(+)